ncbi:hypothetical protein QE152_g12859 [Popillia japonica]|uniref:Maturase K n=1 Tax=Popillia japonica TaxID=7064 RepID=A0AAW1LGG8_POPJA
MLKNKPTPVYDIYSFLMDSDSFSFTSSKFYSTALSFRLLLYSKYHRLENFHKFIQRRTYSEEYEFLRLGDQLYITENSLYSRMCDVFFSEQLI